MDAAGELSNPDLDSGDAASGSNVRADHNNTEASGHSAGIGPSEGAQLRRRGHSRKQRADGLRSEPEPEPKCAAPEPRSPGLLESAGEWLDLDLMNVPVLSEWLRGLIDDMLADTMVRPNAVTKPDWREWLAAGAQAELERSQRLRRAAWVRVHRSLAQGRGHQAAADLSAAAAPPEVSTPAQPPTLSELSSPLSSPERTRAGACASSSPGDSSKKTLI